MDRFACNTSVQAQVCQQVLSAIESLYADQLKPYGRILRKRLGENISPGNAWIDELAADMKRLRAACEACDQLQIKDEEGNDWSALLVGRADNFINVYSPEDVYPASLWKYAGAYFETVADNQMTLPGGRYSCAQELASRDLSFLRGLSLGQICHIVQLAISQKKVLGYLNGAVVPYARSQSIVKDRCAEVQRPCSNANHVRTNSRKVADWPAVHQGLRELFCGPAAPVAPIPLSNIKRIFRTRFHVELSDTALGHAKLSELLQDPRLDGICTVCLQGRSYVVMPGKSQNASDITHCAGKNEPVASVEKVVGHMATPCRVVTQGQGRVDAAVAEKVVGRVITPCRAVASQRRSCMEAADEEATEHKEDFEDAILPLQALKEEGINARQGLVRNTFIDIPLPSGTPVVRARRRNKTTGCVPNFPVSMMCDSDEEADTN